MGGVVNLERALPLGGRMGGHLVTGHVDGVGLVTTTTRVGSSHKMVLAFPPPLARFIAEKGSVCVSGVSLTVNGVTAQTFDVMIVPHTLETTSLALLSPGSAVNIEVDILARYVLRAREVDAHGRSRDHEHAEWMARLERSGYV